MLLWLCCGLAAWLTRAAVLTPTSYVATRGEGVAQVGSWNYFDETGRQLTDGFRGVDDWTENLGHGIAYEWVAWRKVNPTLTFNFAGVVTIDKVFIDFERWEYRSAIYLPSNVNIGGTDFSLAGDEIPDYTHGTIEFPGAWTGSSLTITLTPRSGGWTFGRYWTFVDEVQFSGIPEPSAAALIAGLGLVGFGALRRGRGQRSL